MGGLHWNYKSRVGLTILVVSTLVTTANAGLMKRSIRTVREVYPPDIEPEIEGNQAQVCTVGETVYEVDDIVPAAQPCLKCRCQPPIVQCETVQCVKRPGCKAIHRPNRCCPDYQCECEYNGRIYANGEKLETNPGGECKVCYCRGGEIQCAEVSCYIRKDCEGKRVPGKCCPKYDHCPPIDLVPERPAFVTEAPPATPKSVIDHFDAINLINSTHPPISSTAYSITADENKVPDTDNNNLVASKLEYEELSKANGLLPRITIQEIIPERKEIPITAPPKLDEPQGTLLIEEAIAPSERMDDLSITDSDPESSEIAEVFQHPPPVLRIGDKLLFLKKGEFVPEKDSFSTPQSVITIIGAEGLQRGFEESFEIQDGKSLADNVNVNAADTNELELKTAESTHILSLVKRKQKAQITTTTDKFNESNKQSPTTVTTGSVDIPIQNTETINLTTEAILAPESNSDKLPNITQTPPATSTEQAFNKITEPIAEQNPAYPPIPDIMPAVGDVSQKFEVELESDNETMKILPGVFELLDNSTQDEHNNKSSHTAEWLKTNKTYAINTQTLINYNASLPKDLLNARSPIDDDLDNSSESDETLTTSFIPIEESKSSSKTFTEKNIQHVLSEISTTAGTESIKTKISFDLTTEAFETTSKVDEINEKSLGKNSTTSFKHSDSTKSIESLENDDSGEHTTQKPSHSSSSTTDENASVPSEPEVSEATDMTKFTSKESREILEPSDSDKSEATTKSLSSDVEMLIPVMSIPVSGKEFVPSVPSISVSDVEMITEVTPIKVIKNVSAQENAESIKVEGLPKPTMTTKVESSTYEFLPMPEHALAKIIKKRDIGLNLGFDDASIEVFPKPQQVVASKKKEQSKEKVTILKMDDPEEKEAQDVFKELLDELSTEHTIRQQRSRNGQDALDGFTGALTSFALGGGREAKNSQSNNGGVLGFIGNIFSPNRGRN